MNEFWTNFGDALQGVVPEVQTDVGSDLQKVLSAYGWRIALIIFMAMLLSGLIVAFIAARMF